MRLGLLGPATDHRDQLESAARWIRDEQAADRVLYLGSDRMLDDVVSSWAEQLVGPRASDFTVMSRATARCLHGDPEEIDEFLSREKERTGLRMYESLPGETTRSVELVGGKVAVMLYDKAHLEEDDILPATLLIFGKSSAPLVKQVGRRWFLSPGSFPEAGVMLIDDDGDELRACTFDKNFQETASQVLSAPKSLRMRVAGG